MNTTVLDRERLIACRKKLGITKQEAAKLYICNLAGAHISHKLYY